MSRKDKKNRVLRKGESQRKDGTYMYRYIDLRGNRKSIYDKHLSDLRKKDTAIRRDVDDGIGGDGDKISLNELFDRYMSIKNIANSTRVTYTSLWNYRIRNSDLGAKKITVIRKSDIMRFYRSLEEEGLKYATIRHYDNMLSPCLQMAVDDDLIRKNPCAKCVREFAVDDANKKNALSLEEQEEFLDYIKDHNIYKAYCPIFVFMIETALRCGETIGLTWDDIDLAKQQVRIDHQLVYKKKDGSYQFYVDTPKTGAGVRVIPLTSRAAEALAEQKKMQFARGWRTDVEIDGYADFVFSTKNKTPIMPSAVNNVLLNIVKSHNTKLKSHAALPHISAHMLRHTGCTRMAESGMDPKVLQYIMGHSSISVTMDVYNHVSDRRCREEMDKMEQARAV
ncbi:MAG: site-specific integrase [Lachnospiraceae bacterium]|nr:site-specific integrase [Lachnospiraceae bacterium]